MSVPGESQLTNAVDAACDHDASRKSARHDGKPRIAACDHDAADSGEQPEVKPRELTEPYESCQPAELPASSERSQLRVRRSPGEGVRFDRGLSALWPVLASGEDELVRLAARQRGLLHREQLLAAGLSRHVIARRVRARTLTRACRSVYSLGPQLPGGELVAETMVAIRFDGYAVLSGLTAAALWGVLGRAPDEVQVTLLGRTGAVAPAGVVAHTSGWFAPQDLRRRHGLPVLAPARTLLDVAPDVSMLELESMLAQMLKRHVVRVAQIRDVIARSPQNHPGVGRLATLLDAGGTLADLRSYCERTLLRLIESAELPRPQTNVWVGEQMVDCYWPDHGLVVEFDSWEFHHDRAAFEQDRLRDQRLVALGMRVQRVTKRQLEGRTVAVIARLASALAKTPEQRHAA